MNEYKAITNLDIKSFREESIRETSGNAIYNYVFDTININNKLLMINLTFNIIQGGDEETTHDYIEFILYPFSDDMSKWDEDTNKWGRSTIDTNIEFELVSDDGSVTYKGLINPDDTNVIYGASFIVIHINDPNFFLQK